MATTDAAADTPPVEDARDELRDAVSDAAAALQELLDAEDERIQIRAAEAILDRAGLTKGKRTRASTAKKSVGGATNDSPLDDLL